MIFIAIMASLALAAPAQEKKHLAKPEITCLGCVDDEA